MKLAQIVPVCLSAAVPGSGHIAAGRPLRGVLIFFLFGFAIDGWLYSQAASILPPERTMMSVALMRNSAIALGVALWLFAVADTVSIARRRRRIEAKAGVANTCVREAVAAFLRSDYPAAVKELRAALRINDQDPDAYFHLGVALASMGKPRQARRAFHACIRFDHDGKWDAQTREQLEPLTAAHKPKPRPAPSPEPAREEEDA